MNQSKKAVDKLRSTLTSTSNPTTQVLIGASAGIVTGYVASKVGRTMTFTTGGGIILYQLAHSKGMVNVSWDQLFAKAESATKDAKFSEKGSTVMNKVKTFSKDNTPFTAGFIGGFLMGAS